METVTREYLLHLRMIHTHRELTNVDHEFHRGMIDTLVGYIKHYVAGAKRLDPFISGEVADLAVTKLVVSKDLHRKDLYVVLPDGRFSTFRGTKIVMPDGVNMDPSKSTLLMELSA